MAYLTYCDLVSSGNAKGIIHYNRSERPAAKRPETTSWLNTMATEINFLVKALVYKDILPGYLAPFHRLSCLD
jgi:hypothetical protein